jgi:hypothetical protein
MKGYDNLELNRQILLDLPFREATGVITHDVAKPHHIATLTGPPTWDEVALSGLGVLSFDGAAQYLEIPAADSLDLDFTGDFSLAAWVSPNYVGMGAMVIICRNTTDVCGWCMWLYENPTLGTLLSLRTSQGGATPHTECYAAGFPDSVWQLVGYSRGSAGLTATCYKNGQPVTTVLGPTGLLDPVACGAADKLLIGVQDGEIANFYKGKMWRPRAWPRQLSADEWAQIFDYEKHWFGV